MISVFVGTREQQSLKKEKMEIVHECLYSDLYCVQKLVILLSILEFSVRFYLVPFFYQKPF